MRLPQFRLKVSTLLAWTAVIALVFTVIAQQIAANRWERDLKLQLIRADWHHKIFKSMDYLLSDRGIDILKNASSVELLRVARPVPDALGRYTDVGEVTATGIELGPEFALRAAVTLLDHRNYNVNLDDLPSANVGMRIKDGSASLDILIDVTGPNHQDVWIEIHDETGKQVHIAGPKCMDDPALQKLAEELLKK